MWLRTDIGFDGWRLDFVKGFHGSHVRDYMEASVPQFAVGERERMNEGEQRAAQGGVRWRRRLAAALPDARLSPHTWRSAESADCSARERAPCVLSYLHPPLSYSPHTPAPSSLFPSPAAGEYWDTMIYEFDGTPSPNQDAHRQKIVDWVTAAGGLCTAFDMTLKGIMHAGAAVGLGEGSRAGCQAMLSLHSPPPTSHRCPPRSPFPPSPPAVFDRCEYWRLRDSKGKPPSLLGFWPSRAVTFLENHDTVRWGCGGCGGVVRVCARDRGEVPEGHGNTV